MPCRSCSCNTANQATISPCFPTCWSVYDSNIKIGDLTVQDKARSDNDRRLTQLLALARVRLLFALRKWDAVPSALADLADLINWREESYSADGPTEGYSLTRHSYLLLHYMLLRSLWEGRLGNDTATKGLLQRVYLMIDEASDTDRFIKLKVHGGLLDVGSHGLYVQSTPANINFLLVFLATVTSRRDYIGYDSKCKSLVHAKAMMEFAEMAKMDDMWDTGCRLFLSNCGRDLTHSPYCTWPSQSRNAASRDIYYPRRNAPGAGYDFDVSERFRAGRRGVPDFADDTKQN